MTFFTMTSSSSSSWTCYVTLGLLLLLLVMDIVSCYRNGFNMLTEDEDDEIDNTENLKTNDETWQNPIDPEFSRYIWETLQNRQPKRRKRKRNKKAMLPGLPGPMGPRGPPGPSGPPGAVMTKEDLLKEFKSLIKDMAEERAERLLSERCKACTSLLNGSYILPPEVDQMLLVPRVTTAFSMRLRRNVNIEPKSLIELKPFYQPFGSGTFQRGQLFKSRDGRFVAPRDGLYQFTAHLHLKLRHKGTRGRARRRLRKRDYVKLQICIDSSCEKNLIDKIFNKPAACNLVYLSTRSLDFISGLESNSRVFTISINGFLELKSKQYASVYVDNSSRVLVKVMNGSDFSGVLFGV